MTSTVIIHELISICTQIALMAGTEIRAVAESGQSLHVNNKSPNAGEEIFTKFDPQTIADTRAQEIILNGLRSKYPYIKYIAEEEEKKGEGNNYEISVELPVDSVFETWLSPNLQMDETKLTIWVDPLDGTRMFIDKNYRACSVLIGISIAYQPIGGIIHLPFSDCRDTFVGWQGYGVMLGKDMPDGQRKWENFLKKGSFDKNTSAVRVVSSCTPSDRRDMVLRDMNATIPITQLESFKATGTMMLQVLRDQADMYLRIRPGTMRWDTGSYFACCWWCCCRCEW
jgi:3'-phosphoadenosine 5'-phosphosulfate (PAPS) 3'-phosphatase